MEQYRLENEKKGPMALEKEFEKEAWKEKIKVIEKRRIVEIQEIRQHLEEIKSSRVETTNENDFSGERIAYEIAINQLKNKINDIDSQYKVLLRENDELKKTIAENFRNLDEAKENEQQEILNQREATKLTRDLYVIFLIYFLVIYQLIIE